uniref:UDP-2-acetamido-2-deoxy-ribo-hexuluronate aminotransferase n=1 Tax=Candidatus Kentrum sp. SD TaxID=2126332 RepID=A0A450YSJ7_9GAMM|nr:MAG: UDP-2-acetamido-2-deoxy-ribo-hexuluronate aminotransferase [Candidatus Kentron sp. SD]VFK44521.1 MAG: UDP-2-acetamido-2-deoxy-ribo-hexuluronate aminotransferase [Candidatus Kentron sp. SD]
MKNLILDVNVVLDLWLQRGGESKLQRIASIIEQSIKHDYRCWVSSASLPILEYMAIRQYKKDGAKPEDVRRMVKGLMNTLLMVVRPLTNYGFQQIEAFHHGNDWEDAQIVLAAMTLQKPTAIVTSDKRFRSNERIAQITPLEVESWLASVDPESTPFIDLKTQQDNIRPQLERNIHQVLHHGQYILGAEVRELEQKLAAYTGSRHCVTVASGTEALLISLMALGVKPGDEVITTPFTFVATAEVIALLGATPVFVDIQPDTCNIDPASIAAAITPKTKAIMPVSLYGQPADMDEINAIAARHGNIPVIEDAAQSFGASYKGKKSCNLSTLGCASFFPSKPLGCYGDGGAIFTNDDALAKACREIRVHGQERRYHHTRIGVGGRMDTLQCAVVLAKLEKFDEEIEQRIRAGKRYLDLLNDTPGVRQLAIRPDRTCVWGQFTILVENREQVSERLRAMGIPTAVHYPMPLHLQPAYQALCRFTGRLDHAERVAKEVLSLPMHPYIGSGTQEDIVKAIVEVVG